MRPSRKAPLAGPWGGDPSLREGVLFLLILAVGIFLRLYRLGEVPPGLTVDASIHGLGGLRVLHEGWRPFLQDDFSTHPGLIFYLTAAWFRSLEPTFLHWSIFSAFLSILALAAAYPFFRGLAGPGPALAAFLFLAVMRWDLALSRAYPLHDAALFMAITLWSWSKGMKEGGWWAFAGAAIAFSLGLYTYHGYKPFLLLMGIYVLFEALADPGRSKDRRGPLLLFLMLSLVLMAPMFWHWVRIGSFGDYEAGLFIGAHPEGPLRAFFGNLKDILLCLHFQGDRSSYVNFASRPMLDPVTGLFFLVGSVWALRHWRTREAFYPLAGLVVMSLNGLLSMDAGDNLGRRLFGTLPFLSLLAGLGAVRGWGAWAALLPGKRKAWAGGLLGLVLVVVGALNFREYFILQSKDQGYRSVSDPAATFLAERIAREKDRWEFLVDARYEGHPTLRFMDPGTPTGPRGMGYPEGLLPPPFPGKEGVCFVLGEGGMGLFGLLRTLHPLGLVGTWSDGEGPAMLHFLRVDNAALLRDRGNASVLKKGLEGSYWRTTGTLSPLTRKDPLINFPHRSNLTLWPGGRARWKGRLRVVPGGPYEFLLLTESGDRASLWIDGKSVVGEGERVPVPVTLAQGSFPLVLEFVSGPQKWSALSLAWKKPGADRFEIIPHSAFDPIR